jgi:hypothetical protein
VNLSVAGAQVGQVAYFSTIGNVAVPPALVAGPMKLTAPTPSADWPRPGTPSETEPERPSGQQVGKFVPTT